jgi:hypothetical protein
MALIPSTLTVALPYAFYILIPVSFLNSVREHIIFLQIPLLRVVMFGSSRVLRQLPLQPQIPEYAQVTAYISQIAVSRLRCGDGILMEVCRPFISGSSPLIFATPDLAGIV